MKQIEDYQIVEADTKQSLRASVIEKFKQGYYLHEGVSIAKIRQQDGSVAHFYAQAMVKYF
jgi:hypothetical protein